MLFLSKLVPQFAEPPKLPRRLKPSAVPLVPILCAKVLIISAMAGRTV